VASPTEADFKAAQQARIEQLDRRLRTTRMNHDSQEANLAQLLGHATDFSRRGKPVPHALDQRIGKKRKTVDSQRELLEHLQTKRATAQKEASARLAHYRELQARQKRVTGTEVFVLPVAAARPHEADKCSTPYVTRWTRVRTGGNSVFAFTGPLRSSRQGAGRDN